VKPLESTGTLKPLISQRHSKQLSNSSIDNQLRSFTSGKKGEGLIDQDDNGYEEGSSVRLTLDEEKKEKTNQKFLRYKFNPTEEPLQTLNRKA
jgi:hypothetical protein